MSSMSSSRLLTGHSDASMINVVRERKSYIILVLICIFLCGGVLTLTQRNQHRSDQRWCGMLAIEKLYSPPKPTNPGQNPQEERVWLLHVARLKLFKELGC